ncbi:MAG: TlpA family protein disulfide reductase [Rhodospirillales bacterium]|nr:TlpA family protein disulfide reductase [Rhodospirillales bacterium]
MSSLQIKLMTLTAAIIIAVAAVMYDAGRMPGNLVSADSKTDKPSEFPAAPDFTFTTLAGKAMTLSSVPESGVLLHFWAAWCTVCMAEFPSLLKAVAAQEGRVALIAVSTDDSREKMDRALAALRSKNDAIMDSPYIYWVWDDDKDLSLKQFSVARVPETFFIDSEQRLVHKAVGEADWVGEDMADKLFRLSTSSL